MAAGRAGSGIRLQVQSETATLAPFVPRALLARLARPIDVLTETVNCTVVFADVSGFTRLSERLARRGNEGAEQLVDLINACFTALLAEAYGRGGSLVKFGGDAMVLLFYDQRGDEQHAVRACCAAAAMRRRLREIGRGPGRRQQGRAADFGGRAHRRVRDVRGRRVAPGALDRRCGGHEGRRAGGVRVRGADPDQPGDRPGPASQLRGRQDRTGGGALPLARGMRVGTARRAAHARQGGDRELPSGRRASPSAEGFDGPRAPHRRDLVPPLRRPRRGDRARGTRGDGAETRRAREAGSGRRRTLRGVLPRHRHRQRRHQDPVERRRAAGGG